MMTADVTILGGGMAGVSLAAALAPKASVALIEIEEHLGRHATGRSAAMFFASYGNQTVRALTRASRDFLVSPPLGFCETPLMSPRAALFIADEPASAALETLLREPGHNTLRRVTTAEAIARVPILSADWLAAAALDESGFDIDVASLLQGYLAAARRAGAKVVTNAGFVHARRGGRSWRVETRVGAFESAVLVNATGAWADQVASSAGVRPLGLAPLRRSAITFAAPPALANNEWPFVVETQERFYFKPDAGQILLSPANEDADVPGDAAPDELDVAIAVDRFERATTMEIKRINHRWAGLRTFAPDRTPVAGFDPDAPGFFWLAGQGGYGIQTAPALAALAAAQILGEPHPESLAREGIRTSDVAAGRPGLRTAREHR